MVLMQMRTCTVRTYMHTPRWPPHRGLGASLVSPCAIHSTLDCVYSYERQASLLYSGWMEEGRLGVRRPV
jgi:hypothetical protein